MGKHKKEKKKKEKDKKRRRRDSSSSSSESDGEYKRRKADKLVRGWCSSARPRRGAPAAAGAGQPRAPQTGPSGGPCQ